MVDPKTVRRTVAPDAPELRHRLRELAGERRRFGYRRLGVLAKGNGDVASACRPFDRRRQGFVVGCGGTYIGRGTYLFHAFG